MSVTCYECKESELASELSRSMESAQNCSVYNLSTLHLVYGGVLTECLSVIISKISNAKDHTLILSSPDSWMSPVRDLAESVLKVAADSDSDESETDFSGGVGQSLNWVDTLFSVVNYFKIFSDSTNHLLVLFTGSIPKKLAPLFPIPVSSVSQTLNLASQTFDMASTTCICLRGISKTSTLKAIASPTVWIFPHELVSCELGESMRIVGSYFSQAAKLGGAVVFDDADLTLNTSGRIIAEIVDEIGLCLTEYRGKVFFIFSISTPINASIMNRIDCEVVV